MALTNAEHQARWRARRKQELTEPKASSPQPEPAPPAAVSVPPPLPANIRKASRNQYDRREGKPEPPPPQAIPDEQTAKNAFAARMRQARLAAGLSQAQVAAALFGPDPRRTYVKRYINWECGRSPMALNVIPAFARLVGTDVNFLFG